jgi:hypothetical protein
VDCHHPLSRNFYYDPIIVRIVMGRSEINPQKLLLYNKERELLDGNDVSNEDKRRRNIRNDRLPQLGERIHRLLEDIELLNKGGYLEPEYDQLSHEDIFDVSDRFDINSIWAPCSVYAPEDLHDPENENSNLEITFGAYLGRQLRNLTTASNNRVDLVRLIWGILLGAFDSPEKERWKTRNEIAEVVKFIEEKQDQRAEWLDRQYNRKINNSSGNLRVNLEVIAECLKPGEPPIPALKSDRYYEISALRGEIGNKTPISDELEDLLISDELEDSLRVSIEQAQIYLQILPRIRGTIEWICDKKYKNVQADLVFRSVWNHCVNMDDSELNSTDKSHGEHISSRMVKSTYNNWMPRGEQITDRGTASKLLADLSEERSFKHTWATLKRHKHTENVPFEVDPKKDSRMFPVVEEVSGDSSRGRNWKTTAYGNLVGSWMFTEDGSEIITEKIAEALFLTDEQVRHYTEQLEKNTKSWAEHIRIVGEKIDEPFPGTSLLESNANLKIDPDANEEEL